MTQLIPLCPLCDRPISCDSCGPIEGGHVWIRKGETKPSAHEEGVDGDWLWVCDRCRA